MAEKACKRPPAWALTLGRRATVRRAEAEVVSPVDRKWWDSLHLLQAKSAPVNDQALPDNSIPGDPGVEAVSPHHSLSSSSVAEPPVPVPDQAALIVGSNQDCEKQLQANRTPQPDATNEARVVGGDRDKELSPRQEAAVFALVAHPDCAAAARSIGVDISTLWRWRKLPAFQRRFREVRRELLSQTIGRLQAASVNAVNVLDSVATDTDAPTSQRLQAARMTLDLAFRAAEIDDVGGRIDELECQLDAMKQGESASLECGAQGALPHETLIDASPVDSVGGVA